MAATADVEAAIGSDVYIAPSLPSNVDFGGLDTLRFLFLFLFPYVSQKADGIDGLGLGWGGFLYVL